VHRAAVRDLQEPLALLFSEITLEPDLASDLVHLALSCLAIGAVLGMDLPVREAHVYTPEGQVLPLRVHAQRHGRAGAEPDQELFVWARAGIVAADGLGLVHGQGMAARAGGLQVAPRQGFFYLTIVGVLTDMRFSSWYADPNNSRIRRAFRTAVARSTRREARGDEPHDLLEHLGED